MESVKSSGTEQLVKSSLSSSPSPPWQSNLQQAAMEELNKGQKQAKRLLLLLKGVLSSPERRPAAELLVEVGAAFTNALSFLELKKEESESDKPPINSEGMSSSHEQIKRKFQTLRRSSCRRRAHPYSCTTVFSPKIEDGHGWRKYGQKGIYGSKHPRSYYRCIHKHDRSCPVTRQVQRTEEDDSIFAITYVGLHTCMEDDHTAATKLQSLALESKMNKNDNASDDDRKESAVPPSAMKRDCEEEMTSNESTAGSCSSSEISSMFSGLAPLSAEDGDLDYICTDGDLYPVGNITDGGIFPSVYSNGFIDSVGKVVSDDFYPDKGFFVGISSKNFYTDGIATENFVGNAGFFYSEIC